MRHAGQRQRRGHIWFSGTLLVVTALAGCGVDKPSQHELEMALHQQEPRLSVLVDKIEKYRTDNGRYPSDLQAFGNATDATADLSSQFKTLRTAPAQYEVARDHSFFRLTYGLSDPEDYELHASSSYLSFEKRWHVDRYVERFPHVEAQYFGALYQQGHSPESLRLTIASLIEASTSNSAFPCRNLWAEWIDKALGAGEPQSILVPSLPGSGQTDVYATKNSELAYAIAIDRKIFGSMKKPLPFVVGIYEKNKGNWELVKQCDASQ